MKISSRIEKMYKDRLFSRRDDDGTLFYFSVEDFPGLCRTPFVFTNTDADPLMGYVYSYASPIEGRIVIFDHGMGVGHRAYMQEINMLALHGYRVLAYDHTGCTESGGKGIKGLGGSLADLDCAVRALRGDPDYRDLKISVVGHSWGGFSTMNIPALHPDVESVVAISGFASVYKMLHQVIPFAVRPWTRVIRETERLANPRHAELCGWDSLRSVSTRALIIHSTDDKIVSVSHSFNRLKRQLSDCTNVSFLSVKGKGHLPHFTANAVRCRNAALSAISKARRKNPNMTAEQKKALLDSFDWRKITEQDANVWQKIFEHLAK